MIHKALESIVSAISIVNVIYMSPPDIFFFVAVSPLMLNLHDRYKDDIQFDLCEFY